MKTIGLIGGMSWESTITYYEILNKEIAKTLGGFHSAKIMMYNVDFAELEANMSSGNWERQDSFGCSQTPRRRRRRLYRYRDQHHAQARPANRA